MDLLDRSNRESAQSSLVFLGWLGLPKMLPEMQFVGPPEECQNKTAM
jgi:hypothetical protein